MTYGALVHSSIFRVTGDAPFFLNHKVEGDVAFWGPVLEVSREPKLRDYLVQKSVGGLWEFHSGFGVTSADSALVLEGLLAIGHDKGFVAASVEKLVADFYCPDEGGFRTVIAGRAEYWKGCSLEITAQAAWILSRVDPVRWYQQIAACVAYVLARQENDGLWSGKWFPSRVLPSYYAIRLLMAVGLDEARRAAFRACTVLLRIQSPKGDWSGLVIDTAAAVRALHLVDVSVPAVDRGRQWLVAALKSGRASGELVLYYWYENTGKDRVLFMGRDFTGNIARAWAGLALQGM